MIKTPRTLAASVVLATLAIAGCGSDSKSSSTTVATAATSAASSAATSAETTAGSTGESAAAGGATMEIQGFKFGALTAAAGETITVTNGDSAKHTVTADDGSFDAKVDAGGTTTFTVDAPGTYEIHCEVHPKMTGSITIN